MVKRGVTSFGAALGIALALLGGCAEQGAKPAGKKPVDAAIFAPRSFADLPGWAADDLRPAAAALARSCKLRRDEAWRAACAAMPAAGDSAALHAYFETYFRPWQISEGDRAEGLFTGYYEAELRGSTVRGGNYQTPVYGVPRDLVTADLGAFLPEFKGRKITGRVEGARFVPYPDRAGIVTAPALPAPVLLWADDPLDVFFLQVQGSGRALMQDGSTLRLSYAAQNGKPYTAIGKVMKDRGYLPAGGVTMGSIRAWLAAHPEDAPAILNENPSYVFFKRNDAADPVGAQGVPLTPERSLAVDPHFIPLGTPVWLDTVDPDGAPLQRLTVAQDTGGAIKGPVRGDVYWGHGERATAMAGRMQSKGKAYLLLPAGQQP